MNKEDLVSLNYKAECDRLKQELNEQKDELQKRKVMIKDSAYSEDGITYMSDKQYNNYIDIIEQLQQENKQLKEHIEKYEHYCKTTGIEELMKENKKYKEVIEKAIEYLDTKRIREKAIVDVDVLKGILKEVE